MNQPTPYRQFVATLADLPVYTASFAFSLMMAIMSDAILTALTIASVTLGFITGPLIAVSSFFFVYVFVRTINSIANAIGFGARDLRTAVATLCQPPLPPPQPPSEPRTSTLPDAL